MARIEGAARNNPSAARALSLLHSTSAVHRDITPRNVFVTGERVLKLGDFGIALHSVGDKDVPADAFTRQFAPAAIQKGKTSSWRPADDVYQVGCLYVALLRGSAESLVSARGVRRLACSPEAKSVIQRSIGDRRKRFVNSGEMLARLERQESQATSGSRVRTLKGKRVVFTGTLSMPRAAAKRLLRRAGGVGEDRVSHRTDIVVVGEQSPHWKAEKKGQKLLDLEYERELGHPIALINERRFLTLTALKANVARAGNYAEPSRSLPNCGVRTLRAASRLLSTLVPANALPATMPLRPKRSLSRWRARLW